MTRKEQLLKSLDSFKDWSNYMLVTTVAALGWIAAEFKDQHYGFEIACFAFSIVFAIFTLALIPIIGCQIKESDDSFYDVWPRFRIFYLWGPQISIPIKAVCLPQHVLFLLGILRFSWHFSH